MSPTPVAKLKCAFVSVNNFQWLNSFGKVFAKLQIQPESEGLYIQVVVVVRLYAKIQTRTNMSQTKPDQTKK